jgi:uridylate kinase
LSQPTRPHFKRALIKLSGEALAGDLKFGLDPHILNYIAHEISEVQKAGIQAAIVVGGGNFIRGETFSAEGGIDRSVADQMGMLGTLMNSLGLQSAIEKKGIEVRVQSAITIAAVAEPFIRRRALRHLQKGRMVVFAAGTGNPFFSTDTAAVLRALEIEADVIVKATKVDGVYDSDPNKNPGAKRYDTLSYNTAISDKLKVMDQTAFTMAEEHRIPLIVLDFHKPGSLLDALTGGTSGTLVGDNHLN